MVVLFGQAGQLGNRLFNISAFIANSIENSYKLEILGFGKYYNYFKDINGKAEGFQFILNERIVDKIKHFVRNNQRRTNGHIKIFGQNYNRTGNIHNEDFVSLAKKKNLYVTGWPYWDVENFIKHSEYLRNIFTPIDEAKRKCDNIITDLKKKADILIGVHVRLGDYKEFMDGKYYFKTNEYCKIIQNFNMHLKKKGNNPLFVVCSNEKIDFGDEMDFEFYISQNNAIEDLTLLSRCNYIFGPPSTFSMWSSFFGKVPLKVITDTNENLELSQFSEVIANGTFANGDNISNYI